MLLLIVFRYWRTHLQKSTEYKSPVKVITLLIWSKICGPKEIPSRGCHCITKNHEKNKMISSFCWNFLLLYRFLPKMGENAYNIDLIRAFVFNQFMKLFENCLSTRTITRTLKLLYLTGKQTSKSWLDNVDKIKKASLSRYQRSW